MWDNKKCEKLLQKSAIVLKIKIKIMEISKLKCIMCKFEQKIIKKKQLKLKNF